MDKSRPDRPDQPWPPLAATAPAAGHWRESEANVGVTIRGLEPDLHPDPIAVLEQGLSAGAGRPVQIIAADAKPLASFSTHPIDRLQARLADGTTLPVIFKRLQPGPEADIRRECEVRTYRRLLAGRRFGAPLLYAWLDDDVHGQYWLFLEDVGDWVLDYCKRDSWERAFRWQAQLHARYLGREDELAALDCLGEHGPGFYRNLARTAGASLLRFGTARQLARFDALVDRGLERTVARLARLPRTLIHGDLSGQNLAVQPDGRIRPIDWEWAAIGLPAWDLTRLLAGWPPAAKARFVAAYLDELALHTAEPPDPADLNLAVTHCRILRALWYLRWWTRKCQDPAYVDHLLDKMESLWRGLERVGTGYG